MIWLFLLASMLLTIRLGKFDFLAVFLYASIVSAHTLVGEFIPESAGFAYFLSAALADFFVISSLYALNHKTSLIINLQKVSLLFIYVNLFGWMLYETYHEPIIYNILCYGLYVLALAAIFKDGSNELAINRVGSVISSVFGIDHKGSRFVRKDGGKKP